MRSMNKVFLMGHLGHAPELKMSKSGRPYTRLNLATNRLFKKEDGGYEEKPDWHSVFVWGNEAERCAEYLRKGAMVFVEGALSYWQVAAENDSPGYKNAVHAESVRFITYGRAAEGAPEPENLDIPTGPRNHNAVAHPMM